MARFFIDRPVLGVVISAVVLLAGLAAVKNLPIAQYPEITPPTVQVSWRLIRGRVRRSCATRSRLR